MSSRVREVLTLSEAANYLRVSEGVLLQLANERRVPARKVGDEWRFSAAALQQWLRCDSPLENGAPLPHTSRPDPQAFELLLAELESRLLPRLRSAEQPALRGNKERLLALAGAWKDDPTLDEMLGEIYKRRGRPMIEEPE
jgi:excisionase family DNA binding protein